MNNLCNANDNTTTSNNAEESEESFVTNPLLFLSRNEEKDDNDDDVDDVTKSQLSTPLKILFALNGAIEALPTLAYISIINDRLALELSYLPAYYAIAFLPYSFKPLFAMLSSPSKYKNLLILLMIGSSIFILATSFIKSPKDTLACYLITFGRGLFISWWEFLLGLILIHSATSTADTIQQQQRLLSIYQSQAVTSRNVGSFTSHLLLFGFFWGKTKITSKMTTIILIVTSILPFIGSCIVTIYNVGHDHDEAYLKEEDNNNDTGKQQQQQNCLALSLEQSTNTANNETQSILLNDGVNETEDNDNQSSSKKERCCCYALLLSIIIPYSDVMALLLFQIILIITGLKTPIISVTSHLIWNAIFISIATSMIILCICSFCCQSKKKLINRKVQKMALYLLLRYAIPTSPSTILISYYYTSITKPLYLQLLSIMESLSVTLASKFYENYIAPTWSSIHSGLSTIIVITTILYAIVTLLNIPILHYSTSTTGLVTMIICVQVLTSFFAELNFLPSIILATTTSTSINTEEEGNPNDLTEEEDNTNLVAVDELTSYRQQSKTNKNDGSIQYGFLISCIDFGDQLSDWMLIPIITALGIHRSESDTDDNDGWEHLDWLVGYCAIMAIISLVFLKVIN